MFKVLTSFLIILFALFAPHICMGSEFVKLTQLNTEDGLNQSNIYSLMQDRDGYLWIGSGSGVNTFDGYRINTLHSPDNILLTQTTELLFEDSLGFIWIGSNPKNNYQLDKKNNRLKPISLTAPADYKLEEPVFHRATEDSKGNIWFSTYYEIYFYSRESDNFEFVLGSNRLFGEDKKEAIFRDLLLVGNQLLIATSNGLFGFDIETKVTYEISHTPNGLINEDQNNVKSLLLNEFNQILVGTVEGLYQISPTSLNSNQQATPGKVIIEELNIWKMIEKADFYWLATDKGLYQLTKSGNLKFIFKLSDTAFNTSDDDIVSMIEDREGNLWFGSRADGVFKWHPNIAIKQHYWQKGEDGKKLSENTVTAIHQTPDKAIWIGTQNGLNKIDPVTQVISNLLVNPNEKEVISDSTIRSITHNKDKVWINSLAGIKVFDQKTMKKEEIIFPSTEKDLFNAQAYDILFFDQNNLAIVNADGIYNYNIQTNQVSLLESTATNGNIASRLVKIFTTATGDRDSYFVSGIDRLVKYSKATGKLTDFHQLPKSDNLRTSINDIFRDGDKLWVTYPGFGIYILDANSGKELKFLSEKELGANTVMDIFPDKLGNIWFSTNEGLLRINKTTYNRKIFDSNDGFVTSEFNGGTKQILDNGEVFIGSMKGVFLLTPNELDEQSERVITPHITKVSLMSSEIEMRYGHYDDYHIKLNHDDYGLKLEFSALLFDKPKQVKYRYWIEGSSAIAPSLVSESELFFAFLESGENILNITAIDYETGLESAPIQIRITSFPPPWLSPQAYAIYSILIILLTSLIIIRYRRKALAKIAAHIKIKQSEERLNLALKGGNSGLWDWHSGANSVFEPRLTNNFNALETSKLEEVPFKDRLAAIHDDDRKKVIATWEAFLKGKKPVYDVAYRMRDHNQNWLWYRDMATVSQVDENENPVRVTGTFTNINERKLEQDKMRVYSEAFENTRDIVFVLNSDKDVVAVNQAFYKTTNYSPEEVLNRGISFLTDFDGSRNLIAEIFRHIHLDSVWEGEGLLIRQLSGPLSILINATSFLDNDNNLNFVFALTDISKQKQAENELRKLANYDALTGLPNRALLLDRINHAIEHCRRREQGLAVFFIDLDRFKQINDTLGHDIGDLLLIYVANTIRRSIRHDDTVARLGGDEFVVLLEDIEGIDIINRIARNIIEQMKESIPLKNNIVSTSPSIGIAIYPNDGDDALALLKHADVAMYHAKNAGRNNFQYFENSMNHEAKNRLALESKLKFAMENDEIYLVYQPQYVLHSGVICGMEALARWTTALGEEIPPSVFIPVAEELGLIVSLTEKLMNKGFENLARWHTQGKRVGLAFNLSVRHLHDVNFNSFVDDLLEKYPVDPKLLEFELTESILMEDVNIACRVFGKLAEKGIELALDDFGTGYSSLKYLTQLPINKLKVDMSFVRNIGTSVENDTIINTIISLAKSLGLRTVAEGVETKEQLAFLKEAGVDQVQGYLFSKPLILSDLEKLLNDKLTCEC